MFLPKFLFFLWVNPIWHGAQVGGPISLDRFKILITVYSALKSVETFYDFSYLCMYQLVEQKSDFFLSGWPPWAHSKKCHISRERKNQKSVLRFTHNFHNLKEWKCLVSFTFFQDFFENPHPNRNLYISVNFIASSPIFSPKWSNIQFYKIIIIETVWNN